jgi:hypothetical protein
VRLSTALLPALALVLDLCPEWAQKRPIMLGQFISKLFRRLRRGRRLHMPAIVLAGC